MIPEMSSRSRSTRRWRRVYLALLVLLGAGILWIYWLDHVISSQFEGRRWTVPTQVYARPIELVAGQPMTARGLEQELKRLGYRASDAKQPGTYRRRGGRVDIMTRRARFADALREPQKIRVAAGATTIETIQDADGRGLRRFRLDPLLIGSLFPVHGEDRIVVPPDAVPPLLPVALKVMEDRNFDSHFGVDLRAILRAAWANLRARRVEQGGSTLTQQLVKSYFLDERRSLRRKAQEAVMAILLETRFDKPELMNAYINEIYLGQDGERAIHGFGLASRFYFGKPLDELDLSEVALLVGIVRGPSYYSPRAHPDRALDRRNFVLAQLATFQVVKPEEAVAAARRPLGVVPRGTSGYYPAYLEFVRRELRRDYAETALAKSGQQVFTSLDPRIQALAEKTVDTRLAELDRRSRAKDRHLEAALIVTLPGSGEVVAVVGGRRSRVAGFNRALDARRPIGSLVKPIVYLAALETGEYHAATLLHDEEVEVRQSNGKTWRPQNFDRETLGPLPLYRALAESRNLATVQLGLDVGLKPVAQKFTALGLDREPAQVPSLLLGAVELTPMEVAQVYETLANGGTYRPLLAVQAVWTAEGKSLGSDPAEAHLAADPDAVYQLNRMLIEVMLRGTGRAGTEMLPEGLVTAGKTGTSSDLRDSWFAGFSGSHLVVVWVGYDDNAPTGLTGSQGALPIWASVMSGIGPLSWQAPMPDGLEEAWVDYETGLLTDQDCGDTVAISVPRGTPLETMSGCGSASWEHFTRRLREWWRLLD